MRNNRIWHRNHLRAYLTARILVRYFRCKFPFPDAARTESRRRSGIARARRNNLRTTAAAYPDRKDSGMDFPDLDQVIYPRFEFPWPGGCHPEVKNVEERMTEWGSAHGLIPDEDYRARIARPRYGFLAARCYPRAGLKLLQAIADYFLWFFLADDLFV